MEDLSNIRRYELKYVITESVAAGIKDYISNICSLDKHVPQGGTGYIVNNLYFDTPDLRFYHDTKFRKPTRYKPRVRFYGNKAKDLIWPEIKYRHSSIIWKKRYSLPVEDYPNLFIPREPADAPRNRMFIERFEDLLHWTGARSVLHVRYFREPYVTDLETYGRVTFDRDLCYRLVHGSTGLDYQEKDMMYYDDPVTTMNFESPVLLEIKVETRVPFWTVELIRKFNLGQRGFSKYCYGIDHALGYFTPARKRALKECAY